MPSSELTEFELKQIPMGIKCIVGNLNLSTEQRAKLNAALVAPHIRHTTIVAVLKDWGIEVNAQSVSHHRRGVRGEANGCKCQL